MHLVKVSPNVFAIFVNWLYRSAIGTVHRRSYLFKLADCYIFADKICVPSFKDATTDTIQDISRENGLGDDIFLPLLEKMSKFNLPYESHTQFCVYVVVDSFVERHGNENKNRARISVKKNDTEKV
ncbi:hypothetical protein ONS95_008183 [Cadophora gregata]|uniref:uncharacterized protein n=1 Tax=Cadophora gregata TaxID=51156 RepID=UPI0026DDCC29|nr:uncharacterized protein ONS95_008183 [Cadophora gregata]KAK0106767.1 hypothetical protein ONS96_004385 [Cadophora gregata f. sp. sojae]KAK0119341.1 hypothetical protein ONS96_012394 [Cadophora gregata f. sp. sojae]KAK0126595.1 hypothetical protein ONS95_008183 [Cadophora gregata]